MDFRGHEWVLVGRTVIAATMCAATAIFGLGLLLAQDAHDQAEDPYPASHIGKRVAA